MYLGLMSGTSADGFDVAIIDTSDNSIQCIATYHAPMPSFIKQEIFQLCETNHDEIDKMGQLDRKLGELFAKAANDLLAKQHLSPTDIIAIGCHGQTIRHRPNYPHPFTLQIGDPNTICEITGIPTIVDFRRRDLVHGGQGAPLAPLFHAATFRDQQNDRIILNLGGIANITYLPADLKKSVIGFDTGPANVLLDTWINKHLQQAYDKNGQWARSGNIQPDLLNKMLADQYFKLLPPKSTGREYFNAAWLMNYLQDFPNISANDVQATLNELTVQSIIHAINQLNLSAYQLIVCGGGVHNQFTMQRLHTLLAPNEVMSSNQLNIDPDFVEACAFAWLAQQCFNRQRLNTNAITGGHKPVILGGIYFP